MRSALAPVGSAVECLRSCYRHSDAGALLLEAHVGGVELDVSECAGTIGALARGRKWARVLLLQDVARHHGLRLSMKPESASIGAFVGERLWRRAAFLFNEARLRCQQLSGVVYNSVGNAFFKGGEWRASLIVLLQPRSAGSEPDAFTCSVAMKTWGRGLDWQRAILLMDGRRRFFGVEPNVVMCGAAAGSCKGLKEWQKAVSLFDRAGPRGLEVNTVVYNGKINALSEGGQWRTVGTLICSMLRTASELTVVTDSASALACETRGAGGGITASPRRARETTLCLGHCCLWCRNACMRERSIMGVGVAVAGRDVRWEACL